MGDIYYDSANDVIVVRGYKDPSNKTPFRIEDIHNYDVSNGWNKTLYDVNPDNGKKCLIVKCHLRIEGGGEVDFNHPNFVMDNNECLFIEKSFITMPDSYVMFGKEENRYGLGDFGGRGPFIGAGRWYNVGWGAGAGDWRCIQIRGKARIYGSQIYPMDGRFSVTDNADVVIKDTVIWNTPRLSSNKLVLIRVKFFKPDYGDFAEFGECPYRMDEVEIQNTDYLLSFVNIVNKEVVIEKPKFINCRNAWSFPGCKNSNIVLLDSQNLQNPKDVVWVRGWNMENVNVLFKFTLNFYVRDKEGNPIKNAHVKIIDSKGNIYEGYTNENGFYDNIVISYKAIVSSNQLQDADLVKGPYDNGYYWNVYDYNPFTIIIKKENYPSYIIKTTVNERKTFYVSLATEKIVFGSLAFANVFEEGEKAIVVIPLTYEDGTPITNANVYFKIETPNGDIVKDWTKMNHLENGLYVYVLDNVKKGTYIVFYKAEYKGSECYGADTLQIVTTKKEILDAINKLEKEIKEKYL